MSDALSALGDFVATGIGDVGNTYQELLLQDSAITPPDPPSVTYETSVETYDPSPTPQMESADFAPNNDAIPGLDIG